MGIFSNLSSQTYRGSKAMLRCEGPQQGHHLGEPQAPDSGRNCTPAGGAMVFTKADALKAFRQVHLTKESSKLLVINTHKGHYRFKRMPFGAKMSQDVFQMKMDLIMERCPGVISIHDDIVVYGVSNEDHDANLINLLNVAQVEGLVLNSKKLELKRPRVSFFGAEYSADGMHPCPKKIQGITEMTPPIDKQQLASFIGMLTYMGNFMPHLSHHTEPLWAMLKQDAGLCLG